MKWAKDSEIARKQSPVGRMRIAGARVGNVEKEKNKKEYGGSHEGS